MDRLYQLQEWVRGNSIHDEDEDMCVPDFSCCTGKRAPREARERFAKAYIDGDEKTGHTMLMMFLETSLVHAAEERGCEIVFDREGSRKH